ncbi:hypothetical protein PR048_028856 [Dryococelus australis]|uniref:Uncharacterized protein n=1 Tax=Dryococelus australis TaxID=614101 RepID=A0ABQ9GED8_9NEOP|nr:hypothetical protein PR048_028856 [Dryococelus australis]
MKQRRNARVGETGDHRENPPTSVLIRRVSHVRKSGGRPRQDSNPNASSLTTTPPRAPLFRRGGWQIRELTVTCIHDDSAKSIVGDEGIRHPVRSFWIAPEQLWSDNAAYESSAETRFSGSIVSLFTEPNCVGSEEISSLVVVTSLPSSSVSVGSSDAPGTARSVTALLMKSSTVKLPRSSGNIPPLRNPELIFVVPPASRTLHCTVARSPQTSLLLNTLVVTRHSACASLHCLRTTVAQGQERFEQLFNNEVLRADEGEASCAGARGRGKREISEKTRPPATLSGTITTCDNPGATSPGFEHGSPGWEASCLTTTTPWYDTRRRRDTRNGVTENITDGGTCLTRHRAGLLTSACRLNGLPPFCVTATRLEWLIADASGPEAGLRSQCSQPPLPCLLLFQHPFLSHSPLHREGTVTLLSTIWTGPFIKRDVDLWQGSPSCPRSNRVDLDRLQRCLSPLAKMGVPLEGSPRDCTAAYRDGSVEDLADFWAHLVTVWASHVHNTDYNGLPTHKRRHIAAVRVRPQAERRFGNRV